MKTKKVLTANLKPGMISCENAYTYNHRLVIQSNTTLTSDIIEKLRYYSIRSLMVYAAEATPAEQTQPQTTATPETKTVYPAAKQQTESNSTEKQKKEEPTYFDRIQASPAFQIFHTTFEQETEVFKTELNSIITQNNANCVPAMLSHIKTITEKSRNPLHLLDMLQCMRGYDDMTYMHSINVALICRIIGEWLHLSVKDLDVLTTAGLLHDIGKLKIPNEIITKPGKLTDEDYAIVKKHPQYGYDILKNKSLDARIKRAALQHHERYNGNGYPFALVGDDIDYFSSIVMIADVYDAMTANRCYRKGICPFSVIETFEKERDRYEPGILYLFLQRTVEAYINTEVQLSNGEFGKVVLLNQSSLARPIVLTKNKTYDLSKEKDLRIATLI